MGCACASSAQYKKDEEKERAEQSRNDNAEKEGACPSSAQFEDLAQGKADGSTTSVGQPSAMPSPFPPAPPSSSDNAQGEDAVGRNVSVVAPLPTLMPPPPILTTNVIIDLTGEGRGVALVEVPPCSTVKTEDFRSRRSYTEASAFNGGEFTNVSFDLTGPGRMSAGKQGDTCKWMFADAATGPLGFNELAHLNPMRWTDALSSEEGVSSLHKAELRPILLKLPANTSEAMRFETPSAAIEYIRSQASPTANEEATPSFCCISSDLALQKYDQDFKTPHAETRVEQAREAEICTPQATVACDGPSPFSGSMMESLQGLPPTETVTSANTVAIDLTDCRSDATLAIDLTSRRSGCSMVSRNKR